MVDRFRDKRGKVERTPDLRWLFQVDETNFNYRVIQDKKHKVKEGGFAMLGTNLCPRMEGGIDTMP